MDVDPVKTQDEPKETKKKQTQVDPSIQCLSSKKACKRKRLRGFDFCHKHILEDRNSPFQQCSFIIKSTGERCTNPAPKAENKKTFCLIHTRDPKLKKAHDEIMRRNMKRKLAQRKAAVEAKRTSSESFSPGNQRSPHESKRPREDSFDQLSALEIPESDGIYALQDNGGKRYDVSWFGENDSDAESVDSEEEDPLRHAGVWTLEEALKICRDKMIRKRSLYLEQYKRLHILFKERKRRHLVRMAAGSYQSGEESEAASEGSMKISEQRAFGLYQHFNGTELLLEKQAKEKRSRGSTTPKLIPQNRCNFIDNMDRCQNRLLPLSKFCLKHICSDHDQRLYKRCTFEGASPNYCCFTPVLQVFRSTACELHAVPLPRYQSDALQNVINPIKTSTCDSAETTIETGPDGNVVQTSGDIEKTETEKDIAEEKMEQTSLNRCNEQEEGKNDSKDLGAEMPGNLSEEGFVVKPREVSQSCSGADAAKGSTQKTEGSNVSSREHEDFIAPLNEASESCLGTEAVNKANRSEGENSMSVASENQIIESGPVSKKTSESCLKTEIGKKGEHVNDIKENTSVTSAEDKNVTGTEIKGDSPEDSIDGACSLQDTTQHKDPAKECTLVSGENDKMDDTRLEKESEDRMEVEDIPESDSKADGAVRES